MIKIRRYKDTDEEKIRNLFKICFDRDMSHNEWVWKYKMSPWGSVAYVAEDDKKLIAHYGAIRQAFYLEGEILWTYQPCDVMTHPDYRGKFFSKKPIVAKVAEMFFKDNVMDFAFGFANERNARLHEIVLGWSKYKKVTLFKKHLLKSNEIIREPFILKVGWDNVNSDDLNDLWRSSNPTYSLSINKDRKYLLWRYMEHPSQYYTFVTLKDIIQKNIVAIAVIKCSDHEMNILDFFVNGGCEVLSALWEMLESYAIKMQSNVMNVWINPEEKYSEYLLRLGYNMIEDFPLSVKIINLGKMSQSDFFSKYCYRMGDYL
jgi:hypothetical protein